MHQLFASPDTATTVGADADANEILHFTTTRHKPRVEYVYTSHWAFASYFLAGQELKEKGKHSRHPAYAKDQLKTEHGHHVSHDHPLFSYVTVSVCRAIVSSRPSFQLVKNL